MYKRRDKSQLIGHKGTKKIFPAKINFYISANYAFFSKYFILKDFISKKTRIFKCLNSSFIFEKRH